MTGFPGYPCPVCRRASGWATIHLHEQALAHVCSQKCAEIFILSKGQPGMEKFEREAAFQGGDQGGAYLDQIGKNDLADLTKEQWGEFCFQIFSGTSEALRKRADDEIPF